MTETNYGYQKFTPLVSPLDNQPRVRPIKGLIAVPNSVRGESVVFTFFDPSSFETYRKAIQDKYAHPTTHETISFRMPKIFETISIINPDTNLHKELDLHTRYTKIMLSQEGFHAGILVETPQGVFTNTTKTKIPILEEMLRKAKSQDGIYLIDENVAFVPREDLIEIDPYSFEKSRLGRALEHTTNPQAPILTKLCERYLGVEVRGFEGLLSDKNANGITNPVLKILKIQEGSARPGDEPLCITAQYSSFGFGIGVLDSAQESVPKSA